MLVGIADDLTQVACQVLAGEGERAPRWPGGPGLALCWQSAGWDIPAQAGGGGVGGGCGSHGGWQRAAAGCPAEGVQGLAGGQGRCSLVD